MGAGLDGEIREVVEGIRRLAALAFELCRDPSRAEWERVLRDLADPRYPWWNKLRDAERLLAHLEVLLEECPPPDG